MFFELTKFLSRICIFCKVKQQDDNFFLKKEAPESIHSLLQDIIGLFYYFLKHKIICKSMEQGLLNNAQDQARKIPAPSILVRK